MSDIWAEWQGQVINGIFPLHRLIGVSDHSGVFLTEFAAGNLPNAALKLVPAIPTLTEAQLSHWMAASILSHPHLIRILDSGRCQLGGLPFLFVVMEYAEQTLAEILPQRALTPDETREMLLPVLAALDFLHGNGLVQGQLKPTNILVVGSQLKLASDAIRPAGEATASIAQPSVYDPPEARDGSFSVAGDAWSLGITAVEALTQHPPVWLDDRFNLTSLPPTLPPRLVGIVRQCLNRDPAKRPTVADLEARLTTMAHQAPAGVTPAAAAPEAAPPDAGVPVLQARGPISASVAHQGPLTTADADASSKRGWFVAALVVGVVAVVAVWLGTRGDRLAHDTQMSRSASPDVSDQRSGAQSDAAAPLAPTPPRATASPAPTPPSPTGRSASRPPDNPATSPASDSQGVIHEEMPDVSRSALETIHGRVKVAVRVTVDHSGKVIDTTLQNPGPSRYFARRSTEAARKWQFAPADNPGSRTQVLQFEFTRGGASGHATNPRP